MGSKIEIHKDKEGNEKGKVSLWKALRLSQRMRGVLHSALVLTHQLGGELAQDVQEGQVDRGVPLSVGAGLLEGKLDAVPATQK